jgi:hypothetical protein
MGSVVNLGKTFRSVVRKKGNVVTKTIANMSLARIWIDATEWTIDRHEYESRVIAPEDSSRRIQLE